MPNLLARLFAPDPLPVALALSIGSAVSGAAQRPWFLRLEGGQATIHRASSTGFAVSARVGRPLDTRQFVRADVGVSYSSADEGYLTLDLGAEARPFPASRITPVAGAGAGLLVEPEFAGPVLRAYIALELGLSPSATVRAGWQLAQHGGTMGPNVWYVGVEFRRRPSRATAA